MSGVRLSRVDLNLFVVFDAIYQAGSLTKAAQQLHLSQPAVSHALARLREQFNDPLFERSGKGVLPTPVAKSMIPAVREALHHLAGTLHSQQQFIPEQSDRIFNLAAGDMLESIALPRLMASIEHCAPNVQIRSRRLARAVVEEQLATGQIDFALDILLQVSEHINLAKIASDNLVVIMDEHHSLAYQDLSLEAYIQAAHIQVSNRSEGASVEDLALATLNQHRTVRLRCQNYHAALQVLQQSQLLLTLPRSLALQWQGYVVKPLPFPAPTLDIYAYWHKKAEQDLAINWFKNILLGI